MTLPPLRVRLISSGDELITGALTDTNAAWLAKKLFERGARVLGFETVPDDQEALVTAFQRASASADVVICTGGLGPTDDDLTAAAVARAAGVGLALDDEALRQVEARWARMKRPMPPVNRKQAMLPEGSRIVVNERGTAPGFARVLPGGGEVICLPGVPSEMKQMWRSQLLPDLAGRFALHEPLSVIFLVAGRGESALQERLDALMKAHPEAIWGFRASMPINQVKLRMPRSVPDAEARFAALSAEVEALLGHDCFGREGDTLGGALGRLLASRGETVAVAESCTAGLVGAALTETAGSSAWFGFGYLTYANEAKEQLLGVPHEMLEAHGAVSEPVALAMAEGARTRSGATWGLAVTGVAGPGGGSPEKPVGTVWIARSGPTGARAVRLQLTRDRGLNRKFSCAAVLDLLRRHVLRRSQG